MDFQANFSDSMMVESGIRFQIVSTPQARWPDNFCPAVLDSLAFMKTTQRVLPRQSAVSKTMVLVIVSLVFLMGSAIAQDATRASARRKPAIAATAEGKTGKYYESLLESPLALHEFLLEMPKGGDLHNHLSGAIYAETLIQFAVQDGLCVDPSTLSFDNCGNADRVPVSRALQDLVLYRNLVNAFSMRSFVPSAAASGHDHFFDTFGKFGFATRGHLGDMVAEASDRAGRQNEQYLELMVSLNYRKSTGAPPSLTTVDDFRAFRDQLLAGNAMQDALQTAKNDMDTAEQQRATQQHCASAIATPGCGVRVRFIDQVVRTLSPDQVFTQMVTGFELAKADPRVVAINMVAPEDAYVAMHDYDLHMRMLDFLHRLDPGVHITLHAGELAPGLVRPDGLLFHIREAIDLGHAERIGHGVDVMYEADPYSLLQEMSEKNILAEICLTSNDVILGVSGKKHPLSMYRKYGVPFAIATDDEGVSRSDMTAEYQHAAEVQHLSYAELKRSARNSLEYSFLPGPSLWEDAKGFRPRTECQRLDSEACQLFVAASEKAQQELSLEQKFTAFESKF